MKFKFTVIFFAAVLFLCSCGVMSGGRDREEKLNTDTDPFKGLEVSFHGEPKKGFADMDVSKCDSFIRDNFKFECKNDGRLSNGETVQVIVSVKSKDSENSGVNIIRYEKDYVVTGVDFYPTEIEGYDKEALKTAQAGVKAVHLNIHIHIMMLKCFIHFIRESLREMHISYCTSLKMI